MKKKTGSFAVVSCPVSAKFLIAKRKDGIWCFFGGNAKKNEIPAITLLREFHEETGIELDTLNYGDKIETEARVVYLYDVDLYETAIIKLSKEHTQYRWLYWEELKNIPATKLNAPAILIREKLKGWYK